MVQMKPQLLNRSIGGSKSSTDGHFEISNGNCTISQCKPDFSCSEIQD